MNRRVMSARADHSPRINRSSTLLRFPERNPSAPGPVRRTRGYKGTAAQRDSAGRFSDWNKSTDFFTDPRWSA